MLELETGDSGSYMILSAFVRLGVIELDFGASGQGGTIRNLGWGVGAFSISVSSM